MKSQLLSVTSTIFQTVADMNSYGMRLVLQVAVPGPAMVTLSFVTNMLQWLFKFLQVMPTLQLVVCGWLLSSRIFPNLALLSWPYILTATLSEPRVLYISTVPNFLCLERFDHPQMSQFCRWSLSLCHFRYKWSQFALSFFLVQCRASVRMSTGTVPTSLSFANNSSTLVFAVRQK